MFSIGEFSKITGLTVKTLRFYHEQGVLKPSHVDPGTGYRYYAPELIDYARVISSLRELEFSLSDISAILNQADDDSDILEFLSSHRQEIAAQLERYNQITNSLDVIIRKEEEARSLMGKINYDIEEKQLEPILVAGIRMKGRYSECGKAFSKIGRKFGRHICDKPLMLHYDSEYREDDANFEPCMPIRRGDSVDGIDVHELRGGRCISLIHQGPYEELGRSYERVFGYLRDQNYEFEMPTREVYIKGPGMIFRGNPKKYLTEIQVVLKS